MISIGGNNMSFITTDDGTRLFYDDFGAGEKTVVYVHGLSDTHFSFMERAGILAKHCRVVVYDQRGHGASDSPKGGYTIERMAKDLRNLIDHLQLQHIVLAGYSLGVHVIFDYVEQFGDIGIDKFVLSVMSPKLVTNESYKWGLFGDFTQKAADETLKNLKKYYGVIRLSGIIKIALSKKYKKELKAFQKRGRSIRKETYIRLQTELVKGDYWTTLDKMIKPTLVIAGDNDIYPVAAHEAVSKRLTNSKLVIIPDASHNVLLERPEDYMRELTDFIL